MDYDKQANQICNDAVASGRITQRHVNILRRTFVLMSKGVQKKVWSADHAVLQNEITIIDDGDGIFDDDGYRIG